VELGIAQGYEISLAAETAHPAQQLPDGAAIRIVGAAIKKEHLANLLFQYLPREDKRIVTDS
jgi:aspartyl/asparaginyl beta-hydroxylase (cupin superfamily)